MNVFISIKTVNTIVEITIFFIKQVLQLAFVTVIIITYNTNSYHLEAASQSDCDYYYTLCQICGPGARFDSIHLALSQLLLLKQASCNPRLSHL